MPKHTGSVIAARPFLDASGNMVKRCGCCQETRGVASFGKRDLKYGPSGLTSQCTECIRTYQNAAYRVTKRNLADGFLRKYGLTMEQVEERKRKRDFKCDICSQEASGTGKDALHVDHCHETGVVRGMLCMRCNNGIGHFGDNVDLMESARRYLIEHRAA